MAGELNLIETLDNGQFINALGQSDARYNQHIGNIKKGSNDMEATIKKAGAMMGTYFGAQALAGFAQQIVEVTGEFQQLDIAFTTMLGSKEKSAELVSQMVATAAKTPFTLQEVSQGGKQLLAYQVAQEDVNDTLIRLGNISAGLGTPLSRLILVFGQVKAKGKLMGDDLRQFTEAGIPMIHELAKQMGVADKEVAALVSEGKIGFEQVEKVLHNLTNEGGMFFNLMESQSKTVTGQISNLKDKFTVMLNDIGSANTGVINDALSGASYLIEHYEEIGKTIIGLVAIYGTYKAAIMATAALQQAGTAVSYTLEANSLKSLLTVEQQAAIAKQGLSVTSLEYANAVRAQVAANAAAMQSELAMLTTQEAHARAEYRIALQRSLNSKTLVAQREMELSLAKLGGSQKQIELAQSSLLQAQEERHIAVKARKAASDTYQVAVSKTKATATALETATTATSTAADGAKVTSTNILAAAKLKLISVTRALNAAVMANPWVAVAVAIAAIVSVVWMLYDGTTSQERAQAALNKTMADAKQKKDDLTGKSNELLGVINSETKLLEEQITAYRELQGLYPKTFDNMDVYAFKALGATEQQKLLNKALYEMDAKNLDAQISKVRETLQKHDSFVPQTMGTSASGAPMMTQNPVSQKEYEDASNLLGLLNEQKHVRQEAAEAARVAAMSEKERISYYKQQVKELEAQKASIEGTSSKTSAVVGWVDKLSEKLTGIKKQEPFNLLSFSLDDINKKLREANNNIETMQNGGNSPQKTGGTKSFWENQKKEAEDRMSGMTDKDKGSKDWNKEVRLIREAESKLKAWDLKQENPKKVAPFGTLEYYDELIKKLKDSVSSFDAVSGRYKNKKGVDITKDIEDAEAKRRELTFRSADEEIAYKKEQYQAYYSLVAAFGKDVADKQFAGLLQSGESYTAYLESQKAKLGVNVSAGTASKTEISTYEKITDELNKINLVKGAWDSFTETMTYLKSESKTTSEYLEKLNQYKAGIADGTQGKNLTPEQRKTAIATIDQTTTKATSDSLNEMLEKYKGYSDKIAEIESKRDADITFLNSKKTEQNAAQINEAIRLRELQAQKETAAVGDAMLKETALYKDLFGDISNMGVKALLDLQKKGESYISGAVKQTGTDGTVTYKMPEIIDVNGQKTQQVISEDEYKSYVDKIKAIGGQVAEKNPFAKLFDDFQRLAKGAKFDKEMFADVGGALQGVNSIVDSARKGLDTLGVKLDEQDNKVLDDIQGMISGGATLAMGIATGNPIQMIQGSIELITNGIDLIWGANDRKVLKAIAANEEAVSRLEAGYGQLKKAVDDAYGEEYFKAQAKVVANLQEQLRLQKEEIKLQESREGKKYDQNAVDAATQQMNETQSEIDAILDDMSDRIMTTTGKDFAKTLGDSIFDAISSGANAFDVIEAKSEEVVQNIVKQWLQTKLLEAPLQSMLGKLEDKIITKAGDTWTEKDLNTPEAKAAFEEFQNGVKTIGTSYANILGEMDYLFDGNNSQAAAKTGAIKGVSEQTAGYIEGNMTGIRLSQDRQETILGATLKIEQSQLEVLHSINQNGITMNDLLQDVLDVIRDSDGGLRAKGIV